MKLIIIGISILQKLGLIFGEGGIDSEDIQCPPLQEIGCSNWCLEKTCGNIFHNGEQPRICPLFCQIGCVCQAGYVWANGGSRQCVKIDTCPKICCAVNRVYRDCGPFEPRSCDNRELVICNEQENCNKGCFCSDGLVEDGFGNCIPEENCPTICGENELEDQCMNVIQPTCTNPYPPVCDSYPCQRGCVCKPPYIRNEATGQCVDRNNCGPPRCPKNQIYKESGIDCWTCKNYKIVKCAPITIPQCFCIDDYVHHDKTGECISKSDCASTVCPANQTYSTYSDRDCQTCSNWDLIDCMPKSTPDCYCDGGYVHPDDDPKECIATEDCPKPTCGENEEYKIGPNCQTCTNYKEVFCLPTLEKLCVCKSGHVRHDVTGICTLIENCPVCPANETFTNYGDRDCQTCKNWQMIDCRPNDTPACYCSEGFVHIDTATRDCIATEDCPKHTCGVNEVYLHEGVAGVTCENRFYVKFAPQKVSQCYCIEHHVRNVQNVCTHVDNCP